MGMSFLLLSLGALRSASRRAKARGPSLPLIAAKLVVVVMLRPAWRQSLCSSVSSLARGLALHRAQPPGRATR